MPVKKLDETKTGDIVAYDLVNGQGAVLVKAGTALNEGHLRLLRMWGVDTVRVRAEDGTENAASATEAEKLLDEAEAEIKARFGASLDNEITAEILRVAVEQRAARIGGAEAPDHG